MSIAQGTVSISDSEVVSGSGLSLVIYTAIASAEQAARPLPSLTPPSSWKHPPSMWIDAVQETRLKILRGWARQANAHATGHTERVWTVVTAHLVVDSTHDILLVDGTTAGKDVNITLPSAATSLDRELEIKNMVMSGYKSTMLSGDAIDGAADVALLSDWEFRRVRCNGTTWFGFP